MPQSDSQGVILLGGGRGAVISPFRIKSGASYNMEDITQIVIEIITGFDGVAVPASIFAARSTIFLRNLAGCRQFFIGC